MSKPKYTAYYKTILGCGNYTDIVETQDAYSWLDAVAGQFVGWGDNDEHVLINIKNNLTGRTISSEAEFNNTIVYK